MKNKTDLRIYAKEIRKSLDTKSISKKIVDLIRQTDIYKSAKNVMTFYPKQYEIDLRELINDDKSFFLPKIHDNNLLVCPYCNNLKPSTFNTLEPCSDPINSDILDLVILPALMADKNGYRLGYGKGFYDRFLKNCNSKTIVVIASELLVETLPYDEFDVPADFVIHEKGLTLM